MPANAAGKRHNDAEQGCFNPDKKNYKANNIYNNTIK
jgi:hypothetical protein